MMFLYEDFRQSGNCEVGLTVVTWLSVTAIEGDSVESISRASEKIKSIVDQVSLPINMVLQKIGWLLSYIVTVSVIFFLVQYLRA